MAIRRHLDLPQPSFAELFAELKIIISPNLFGLLSPSEAAVCVAHIYSNLCRMESGYNTAFRRIEVPLEAFRRQRVAGDGVIQSIVDSLPTIREQARLTSLYVLQLLNCKFRSFLAAE